MNYEEIAKKSAKDLEDVRIRKAKVQEQIKTLAKSLGLNENEPMEDKLKALEEEYKGKKEELDKKLSELEAKYKELDGGTNSTESTGN